MEYLPSANGQTTRDSLPCRYEPSDLTTMRLELARIDTGLAMLIDRNEKNMARLIEHAAGMGPATSRTMAIVIIAALASIAKDIVPLIKQFLPH